MTFKTYFIDIQTLEAMHFISLQKIILFLWYNTGTKAANSIEIVKSAIINRKIRSIIPLSSKIRQLECQYYTVFFSVYCQI